MRPTRFLALLALAIVALSLVPSVAGHAAPEPLANEVHVLADDAQDEFYWYDGYDLHHLHVREAYWEPLERSGLVFRFTLYGGFAPGGVSDALHVDVSATGPEGESTVRFSTADDANWSSQLGYVLFSDVTQDDPPFTGVTARMQVLVPYSSFGVEPGDTLEDVRMYSYADEDLRDEAPGGIYVPGSGGQAEVPVESTRLVDALDLTGPSGYLNVTHATDGSEAVFAIENALDNGQHVRVEAEDVPGWNASYVGSSQATLEPGDGVELHVNPAPGPGATRPLPVHVTSDLGAHRVYYIGVNGTAVSTGLEPASVDVAPEQPPKESPSPTVGALVAGLAGALLLARQRER